MAYTSWKLFLWTNISLYNYKTCCLSLVELLPQGSSIKTTFVDFNGQDIRPLQQETTRTVLLEEISSKTSFRILTHLLLSQSMLETLFVYWTMNNNNNTLHFNGTFCIFVSAINLRFNWIRRFDYTFFYFIMYCFSCHL